MRKVIKTVINFTKKLVIKYYKKQAFNTRSINIMIKVIKD